MIRYIAYESLSLLWDKICLMSFWIFYSGELDDDFKTCTQSWCLDNLVIAIYLLVASIDTKSLCKHYNIVNVAK